MADRASIAADIRARLIAEPEVILEDRDLMKALIAANERAMGSNIIDLRGIAMERLEARLDRLEDTHRSVIAAAYENLAAANQVHRAVLALLDPVTFETFLLGLGREVAEILRVDALRLVLESAHDGEEAGLGRVSSVVSVVPPGFVDAYMRGGRPAQGRAVVLRQALPEGGHLYGDRADWIRSEAIMRVDLGPGRLPGMIVMGAEDPHQFRPSHGTDLLAFFAGCFERAMRRWLA
jgi:hypothetical protein